MWRKVHALLLKKVWEYIHSYKGGNAESGIGHREVALRHLSIAYEFSEEVAHHYRSTHKIPLPKMTT